MECNIMLANLLRFVFRDIEKNQDFESLPKLPTWGIRWGEYRDASDMIACADREKKEQKDWNRALRETKGMKAGWFPLFGMRQNCRILIAVGRRYVFSSLKIAVYRI